MQSTHRKIELQAPGDLSYLASQIRSAARSKLDLHLPAQPSDGDGHGADDLRAQTEALVDLFVGQVLGGLRRNVCINGVDVFGGADSRGDGRGDGEEAMQLDMDVEGTEPVPGVQEEEFEPFDEKLRARLAEQVTKRDRLVSVISKHRRETPAASARRFQDAFEHDAVVLEGQNLAALDKAEVLGEPATMDVLGMQRHDEVQRNWERAVEGLGRLNKGLPETRARLERCGDVVGYLSAEKK